MTLPTTAARLATAVAVATLSLTSLAACATSSAGTGPTTSPGDAMQQAETHLDDTQGVQLSLTTNDNPGGTSYLTDAQGVITTAPAFKGTASGQYQGIPVSNIGVVSVGGRFYVDIPIKGFTQLDPSTLCAPDPALLLDPHTGVSSLLAAATDLSAGSQQRGGTDNKETLTPISGTVPGPAVAHILPCSKGDSYDAVFSVSSDGYLRSATVTGDFAGTGSSVTYTIDVQAYDVQQDITAP